MQLVFLGTGAGGGVPSFYCDCAACLEAAQDARYRRTRCAVVVKNTKTTLIDAPPDLRQQLLRDKINTIDNFILTHWHYDHTGGMGELEFYSRMGAKSSIPTWMTSESAAWLERSFGFMQDCLETQIVQVGDQFEIDGLSYTGLEVTHTPGTLGYLIESDDCRVAYIPDTGPLPSETMEKINGVDVLILGATFWGQNWMPEDHLSVDEAIQIGVQAKTKQLYLTHLSMQYDTPVTNQQLEMHLRQFGEQIHIAYDGQILYV